MQANTSQQTTKWTLVELEAHAKHHFEMAQHYGRQSDAAIFWANDHMGKCLWAINKMNEIVDTGLVPFKSHAADYAALFSRHSKTEAA